MGHINDVLDNALRTRQLVLLELHNYGRYQTKPLTKADAALLGDVRQKVDARIQTHPALFGYEIMNEPQDLPEKGVGWATIAQITTDAIRKVDRDRLVLIPGYGWRPVGAHPWIWLATGWCSSLGTAGSQPCLGARTTRT